MLFKQIVFLAINLQIISGFLHPDKFLFKENLAEILTGKSHPFDNDRSKAFLNKLRSSPLPILDDYDYIRVSGRDKRLPSTMRDDFRTECNSIGNPINKSTDFDKNKIATIFSDLMYKIYTDANIIVINFRGFLDNLNSHLQWNYYPKIAALNSDDRKIYLCSGFKVLDREFEKFNNKPAMDSISLTYSTTFKSMIRHFYKSDVKMNRFGIKNLTYNESIEFFMLVRLIQECPNDWNCWPFFENTKKLKAGIIRARFTEISQRLFLKFRCIFIAIQNMNLAIPGKDSIKPYHYENFSTGLSYSQIYNESKFVECIQIDGFRNQVECLNLF